MIEIRLNKEDLYDCRRAGNFRWQLARAAGIKDHENALATKVKKSSMQQYDIIGIKGEMAVARLYDLDFDAYKGGIDEGIDLFYDGVSIDVKSTTHTDGKLIFKTKDAFKSQVGILAVELKENLIGIPGWITREEFKEISIPFGIKGGVCVTQDDLKLPESLWGKMINRRNKRK